MCLKEGAAFVAFQDFNQEVLEKATKLVIDKNVNCSEDQYSLIGGSWEDLKQEPSLHQKFDLILMSEVLYNEVYYQSLFDLVGHVMRPGCAIIIGTKTFYYGLGGGFFAVEKFL